MKEDKRNYEEDKLMMLIERKLNNLDKKLVDVSSKVETLKQLDNKENLLRKLFE